ncbi:MAG: nucleotide kinase domain-containing protein [Candidatus Limnocylindria bacterium]
MERGAWQLTVVEAVEHDPPPVIRVAERTLRPTQVFDTYWRFAAARQAMYVRRLEGNPPPWTEDPILRDHRFTNAYRAADRVSQFLIGEVIYGEHRPRDVHDVVFRILLFKLFNRIDTWRALETSLGEIRWSSFDFERYRDALDEAARDGPVYSAAYVMPPPRLGEGSKRLNHLRLLERMMRDGVAAFIAGGRRLEHVYERLRSYPSMGRFLAFQFTIDVNYSDAMEASEGEFVVAGPGACDGIAKCFGPAARGVEANVIRYMADTQESHFARLGLDFPGLFGRRLQLVDCQNLFCEVDKYARVAHPSVPGISGRSRIKQKFKPLAEPLSAFFPPKWRLAHALPGSVPCDPQLALFG